MRRFLMHVLPRGFVRIRNFGFLANARRAVLLPRSAANCSTCSLSRMLLRSSNQRIARRGPALFATEPW